MFHHVFFTRLAVDHAEMSHGRNRPKPKSRIDANIRFWFAFGSRFLYEQTVSRNFEVRMITSPRYDDVVSRYTFPSFVKFYRYAPKPAYQPWCDLDDVPRPCLVHRLDADDQFSIDFFEDMEVLVPARWQPDHAVMLHTRYIQFDTRSRKTGRTLVMPGPHFSTVKLEEGQAYPQSRDPLAAKHNGVPRAFRCCSSAKKAYAMETIHGNNWVNRWVGGKTGSRKPHPRFCYFGHGITDRRLLIA